MKTILALILLSTIAQSYALPRCMSKEDPSDSIRRGEDFIENWEVSFMIAQNDPEKVDKNYKIVSYEEPRFIKSQKLSLVPGGDSCKRQWTYALIDYVVETQNGERCEDTFVYPYKERLAFTSCPLTASFGLAYGAVISPFLGIEFLLTSSERGYLYTNSGILNKVIEIKFENKRLN